MDDRNPVPFEKVQERLADPRTLDESIAALRESLAERDAPETWDEITRLALAGIVVRHAEMGVCIPEPWRQRAVVWLEHEEIEWEGATVRRLRRQKEIAMLKAEE